MCVGVESPVWTEQGVWTKPCAMEPEVLTNIITPSARPEISPPSVTPETSPSEDRKPIPPHLSPRPGIMKNMLDLESGETTPNASKWLRAVEIEVSPLIMQKCARLKVTPSISISTSSVKTDSVSKTGEGKKRIKNSTKARKRLRTNEGTAVLVTRSRSTSPWQDRSTTPTCIELTGQTSLKRTESTPIPRKWLCAVEIEKSPLVEPYRMTKKCLNVESPDGEATHSPQDLLKKPTGNFHRYDTQQQSDVHEMTIERTLTTPEELVESSFDVAQCIEESREISREEETADNLRTEDQQSDVHEMTIDRTTPEELVGISLEVPESIEESPEISGEEDTREIAIDRTLTIPEELMSERSFDISLEESPEISGEEDTREIAIDRTLTIPEELMSERSFDISLEESPEISGEEDTVPTDNLTATDQQCDVNEIAIERKLITPDGVVEICFVLPLGKKIRAMSPEEDTPASSSNSKPDWIARVSEKPLHTDSILDQSEVVLEKGARNHEVFIVDDDSDDYVEVEDTGRFQSYVNLGDKSPNHHKNNLLSGRLPTCSTPPNAMASLSRHRERSSESMFSRSESTELPFSVENVIKSPVPLKEMVVKCERLIAANHNVLRIDDHGPHTKEKPRTFVKPTKKRKPNNNLEENKKNRNRGVKRKAKNGLDKTGNRPRKRRKKPTVPDHYKDLKSSQLKSISHIGMRYRVAFTYWPNKYSGALDRINQRLNNQNGFWKSLNSEPLS